MYDPHISGNSLWVFVERVRDQGLLDLDMTVIHKMIMSGNIFIEWITLGGSFMLQYTLYQQSLFPWIADLHNNLSCFSLFGLGSEPFLVDDETSPENNSNFVITTF
jgi:hypothetical protein